MSSRLGEPLAPHGTRACWRRGCRRPECCAAETEYQRVAHANNRPPPQPRRLVHREDWMQHAACKNMDPNIFHPPRGQNINTIVAICNTCDVQTDCLNYAIDNGERQGIWGGLSERARRRIRVQRRMGGAA